MSIASAKGVWIRHIRGLATFEGAKISPQAGGYGGEVCN